MSGVARPASLPMYDADRDAVDAWWRAIRSAARAEGVVGVPEQLAWPDDLAAHWHDPHLLLSQTCGYPLVTRLAGVVQVLGAFRYDAPGCEGFRYRSLLVARRGPPDRTIEDFRGRVAVVNGRDSYSGCRALRALVAPLAGNDDFFAREVESGSHRASLAALRDGEADLAAIDCVSLAALRRVDAAQLDDLEVVGATALAPGLPLVTSVDTSPDDVLALRRALAAASTDPRHASVRERLFVDGFDVLPWSTWQAMTATASLR